MEVRVELTSVEAGVASHTRHFDLPQTLLDGLRISPVPDLIFCADRWPDLENFLRQLEVLVLNAAILLLLPEDVERARTTIMPVPLRKDASLIGLCERARLRKLQFSSRLFIQSAWHSFGPFWRPVRRLSIADFCAGNILIPTKPGSGID